MAILSGYLADEVLHSQSNDVPDFLDAPIEFKDFAEGWLSENSALGTLTNTQPVVELPTNFTGFKAGGFEDDFYNRIVIEPGLLDVGNLVSEQFRTITVFNGYFEDKTLESLSLGNGTGIEVTGPATPGVWGPLQTQTYTLTLGIEGPAVIDALLDFDWEDTVDDTVIQIVGARIVVLPFQAEAPFEETLEWNTKILTSYNGTEQRIRKRKAPRQSFSGSYPIPKEDMGRAVNTVYGWLQRRWAIVVWSEAQNVGVVAAGSTSVVCDTTNRDFRVGGLVTFWQSPQIQEVIEIEAVNDGELTFSRQLAKDYERATLCPVRVGRVEGNITRDTTGHVGRLTINYEVTENIVFNPSAPPQFLNYDIYFDEGLLGDGGTLSEQFSTRTDVVDYGNKLETISPWEYNRVGRPYRRLFENSEQLWEYRMWLHRRAGKLRPFWMPTFEADMRLSMTGLVTSTLQVNADDYRALGSAHNHLAIQFTDGSWTARTITGTSIVDENLINVAIDGAGLNVDATDIYRLSFLGLKRLDTDRVEIQYPGNGLAVCQVRILEIKP